MYDGVCVTVGVFVGVTDGVHVLEGVQVGVCVCEGVCVTCDKESTRYPLSESF